MSLRGLAVRFAGALAVAPLPAAAAAPPAAGSARAVRVAVMAAHRRIDPVGTALDDPAGSVVRLVALWRGTRQGAARLWVLPFSLSG